jgi:DNA-binding beta-propeller fold protein YncE
LRQKSTKAALGLLLCGLLVTLCANVRAQAPPLQLERIITLSNVTGRIDHMAIDLGRRRLFVAELGNNTVDVIDLDDGKAMHRIEGLNEPQGIGYAPKADVVAIANAGDGSVRLFRGADFAALGTVALGNDADNVRFDPNAGQFVVGYGTGGLATLDPASGSVVARVRLSAHPEGFQLDPTTRRAYVNVPNAHEIAVVDLATGRQAASWPMADLRANFPMARDAGGAFLAVAFRDPARVALLDAASGSVKASVATCGDADDIFLDAKRRRIYVSCGEGSVDVLQQEAQGYQSIGRIKTASGARTSLFVPELDRLFVAARAGFFGLGLDAAILVLRPAG